MTKISKDQTNQASPCPLAVAYRTVRVPPLVAGVPRDVVSERDNKVELGPRDDHVVVDGHHGRAHDHGDAHA